MVLKEAVRHASMLFRRLAVSPLQRLSQDKVSTLGTRTRRVHLTRLWDVFSSAGTQRTRTLTSSTIYPTDSPVSPLPVHFTPRTPTMPRQLKRRSDAISQEDSDEEPEQTQPPRRQRRVSSDEDSDAPSSRASPSAPAHSSENSLIKRLVRLALATEYSRTPLRRNDINTKILKDANTTGRGRASFQKIFDGAQKVLADTFGMQLVELPTREKTSLKDRRTQATQTKAPTNSTTSKSWILVTTLPEPLKTNPSLSQPTKAPSAETEANYTALYTFVLSLIYLNASCLTDQKLERYLKRVNADTYTPMGSKEKLLQRMMREGYIDKRRDTSSGEEVVEWVPGPRGMTEVGVQGVTGLVRTVYGYGAVELMRGSGTNERRRRPRGGDDDDGDGEDADAEGQETTRLVKIEEDELNAKLSRSLGIRVGKSGGGGQADADGDAEEDGERGEEDEQPDEQPGPSRRRGRPSAAAVAARSQPQTQGRGAVEGEMPEMKMMMKTNPNEKPGPQDGPQSMHI